MEGVAVIVEAVFSVTTGVALGFAYHWKLTLVSLGCIPFMIIGAILDVKL